MKVLRIGLWIAQILLALAFTGAALSKLNTPYEVLSRSQAWAKLFAPGTVKLIVVVELLGVIGIMLPAGTRILPVLTPIAAAGLLLTMVVAGATMISIGQPPIPNVILGGLAAFVAWGRFKKAPIPSRAAHSA